MEQSKPQDHTPRKEVFATHDSMTSKYFPTPFWKQFFDIELDLNRELKTLYFPNITHVYNPVEYAFDLHCQYLKKFLTGPKKLMLIGMNPGPNGMTQNGIPFGNINTVKHLMGIEGPVQQPPSVHPKRPVRGLATTIEEPSGVRIWNLIQKLSGGLDVFSQQCFMHNFCPLAFFDFQGKNITPGELKGEAKSKVRDICLEHLEKEILLVQPEVVIAIGTYVGECLKKLVKQSHNVASNVKILQLAHPSPRSLNNNNWPEKATNFFESNDLLNNMDKFMEEAFIEAQKAIAAGEVPVGCVFVYHNEIIARGSNNVNASKNATRHAEFVCIDTALEFCKKHKLEWKYVFAELSVVVTVEPCIMCASALYDLGVKEIVFGCANDRFGGKTVVDVERFFEKNITVTPGIRANEAMELLKEFYKGENPSAPVPKTKR